MARSGTACRAPTEENIALGADFPGVACAEELGQVAFAFFGLDVANLLGDHVFVARDVVPLAQDADGRREAGAMFHVAQHEGVSGAGVVLVVDEQIFFGEAVAIAEMNDFEIEAVHADAFVAIFSEDQRLAVLEVDDLLAASVFFGKRFPCAVVEDIAILQNFDVGGALVSGGFLEDFFKVLLKDVYSAGDERGFRTNGERDGIEGAVGGAVGSRFCFLADFGCGRILAFRQAINSVVEHQNFEADVAAQHVDGVIAADGEGIAVTGGDPNVQIGRASFTPVAMAGARP